MSHTERYLADAAEILTRLDPAAIEALVEEIVGVRERGGRLFVPGVGGGAGNASHAVNDFRKICDIETYAPTDNVAELTARVNDDGWPGTFSAWLRVSRLCERDLVFVFSVGGGNEEKGVSPNLVEALELARERGARIAGVVGRDGGHTARVADAVVVIPTVNPTTVTPHTEAFQGVIWHLAVSHPALLRHAMKWESVK